MQLEIVVTRFTSFKSRTLIAFQICPREALLGAHLPFPRAKVPGLPCQSRAEELALLLPVSRVPIDGPGARFFLAAGAEVAEEAIELVPLALGIPMRLLHRGRLRLLRQHSVHGRDRYPGSALLIPF